MAMAPALEEYFMTVPQVAEALDVSRYTVYVWIRQNKLTAEYIGDVTLLHRSEIEQLLDLGNPLKTNKGRKSHGS